MAIPDLTKLLYEAAIGKTIADLQRDPMDTLRRLTDKKAKSNDPQHPALMDEIKTLLDKGEGYPALVSRLATQLEPQALKTLVLNLVYHAGKRGQDILRAQELRQGVHIPWTLFVELGGEIDLTQLQSLVEQGKAFGIYIYQLVCRNEQALLGLRDFAAKQSDCVFAVYLPPMLLTPARLSDFRALPGLIPLLLCHLGEGREQAKRLQENGLLFGLCFSYGAEDIAPIRDASYARYAETLGAALALYWPRAAVPDFLRADLARKVEVRRRDGELPIVEGLVPEDILSIDRLLSKEEAFLYFDQNGQRLCPGQGSAPAEGNVRENTLLELLET